MKKLAHIATALFNNTLTERAMSQVKGGIDPLTILTPVPLVIPTISSILEDEKRRERPGGGINTN